MCPILMIRFQRIMNTKGNSTTKNSLLRRNCAKKLSVTSRFRDGGAVFVVRIIIIEGGDAEI
jgi:hypothetical protein